MEKTLIYIVRHGESLGNAKRIYLGHTDLDLSELGYKQAEATAEHLAGVKIDAVYSSDLKRAHNTALPHAKLRGIPVIDSKNLRELNIGDWEGKVVDDLISDHYEEFVLGWQQNFGTFALPGGEKVMDGAERFYREVFKIACENAGKTILIASHAAVIRAFWGKISGIAPEKMGTDTRFPTNASYTTVMCDGERLIPLEFSNDSHFKPEMQGAKI